MNRETLYERHLTEPHPQNRHEFDVVFEAGKEWLLAATGAQIDFKDLLLQVGRPVGSRLGVMLDELVQEGKLLPDYSGKPTDLDRLEALMADLGDKAQSVLDEYCKRHVWTDETDPKHIDCRKHIECICKDEQARVAGRASYHDPEL